MVAWTTQAPAPAPRTHLVLYDGACGLCTGVVRFLLRRDHRQVFRFAPLQGATAGCEGARAQGCESADTTSSSLPSSFHVVADHGSGHARVLTKSDAVLFVARQLGWPWRAAGAVRILPRKLRDSLYDAVARSRYRIFGPVESCTIPGPGNDPGDHFSVPDLAAEKRSPGSFPQQEVP